MLTGIFNPLPDWWPSTRNSTGIDQHRTYMAENYFGPPAPNGNWYHKRTSIPSDGILDKNGISMYPNFSPLCRCFILNLQPKQPVMSVSCLKNPSNTHWNQLSTTSMMPDVAQPFWAPCLLQCSYEIKSPQKNLTVFRNPGFHSARLGHAGRLCLKILWSLGAQGFKEVWKCGKTWVNLILNLHTWSSDSFLSLYLPNSFYWDSISVTKACGDFQCCSSNLSSKVQRP